MRKGKPLRLPIMPFLLRNIWMGAMLLFSLITASTFFITQVWQVGLHPPPVCKDWLIPLQAIAAVSLIGISWAVACWVPFAIIMEVGSLIQSVISAWYLTATSRQFLKELDSPAPESVVRPSNRRASHTRTISSPNLLRTVLLNERQPLLSRRRSFEDQADIEDNRKHTRVAGGTILGIHNLAIVFPQFLVSLTHTSLSKNLAYSKDCNRIKRNIQGRRCGSSQRSYEHWCILWQEWRCLDPSLWWTMHSGM